MAPANVRRRLVAVVATVATVLTTLAAFAFLVDGSPDSSLTRGTRGSAALFAAPVESDLVPDPLPSESVVPPVESVAQIKNVVLLLADDLDSRLFDMVPRLSALRSAGTTLTNFVVTDSLCCPSRTSIMRSQYVHNHKVLSNIPQSGGGWATFYSRNHELDCLPTWLKTAGINTSFIGKYLNGFPNGAPSKTYIPPGWDYFVSSIVGTASYQGYNYTLNVNGTLQRYGSTPADFMNDVLTADAAERIRSLSTPFFLELATYSPHSPAPVAERHLGSHYGAVVPRTPSFNARGRNELPWIASQPILKPKQVANFDRIWTQRLESAESVADSYDAIVAELAATGHTNDTLIMVTSDNGYHMGVHRLITGKQTAYREDSIVPMVLIGPGIPKGASIGKMTSTIDIAPTVNALFGAQTPTWADGRDLMPLVTDPVNAPWRTGILTENLSRTKPGDVDYSRLEPPSFHALRTEKWLYLEYVDKRVELYDLVNDPYEMRNMAKGADRSTLARLHAQLKALVACAGPSCRAADSRVIDAPVVPSAPLPQALPDGPDLLSSASG